MSGSVPDSADKMSDDIEDNVSSALSDDGNASLVGFGEAASSTVSGPTAGASRSTSQNVANAPKPKSLRNERSRSPVGCFDDSHREVPREGLGGGLGTR